MGLVLPSDVVAWADRVVGELAIPPIEVIDVAIAERQPPDELARLLKRVLGPDDLTTAAHRVPSLLRARRVGDDLALKAVADMLWVYSTEAVISEAEREAAANFSYEYECLAYYGTPESLDDEVIRFPGISCAFADVNIWSGTDRSY